MVDTTGQHGHDRHMSDQKFIVQLGDMISAPSLADMYNRNSANRVRAHAMKIPTAPTPHNLYEWRKQYMQRGNASISCVHCMSLIPRHHDYYIDKDTKRIICGSCADTIVRPAMKRHMSQVMENKYMREAMLDDAETWRQEEKKAAEKKAAAAEQKRTFCRNQYACRVTSNPLACNKCGTFVRSKDHYYWDFKTHAIHCKDCKPSPDMVDHMSQDNEAKYNHERMHREHEAWKKAEREAGRHSLTNPAIPKDALVTMIDKLPRQDSSLWDRILRHSVNSIQPEERAQLAVGLQKAIGDSVRNGVMMADHTGKIVDAYKHGMELPRDGWLYYTITAPNAILPVGVTYRFKFSVEDSSVIDPASIQPVTRTTKEVSLNSMDLDILKRMGAQAAHGAWPDDMNRTTSCDALDRIIKRFED